MKKLQSKKLIFLSIVFFLIVSQGNLWAVEYPKDASTTAAENIVSQDTATEKIQKMSEKGEPEYKTVKSAGELADEYLSENGLNRSWNENEKLFVAVGEAFFDSEDPSYDDSFITKRSLASMDAMLEAKAKIIEFIRSDMSAMDRAVTPGTDLNAKFKEYIDRSQRRMEAQKRKLAKLLEDVDKAEAEALRGATFGDRMNAAMDAAIKKLDKEYSVERIEKKKREKFEKYKERYIASLAEYNELKKKIEATKGDLKEKLESRVETISKMPLFGAITVAQFESWDDEDESYEIALVVLWSSKMEKVARSFITGENFHVPAGEKTIREWIDSQDWSTSTGSRRFRDNKGDVYFIGIGSSAIGSSSSSRRRAMGVAEMTAKKEVAMSIFADVSSYKIANMLMEVRSGGSGKDSSNAAESFKSELEQSIKNRQIHGMQELYGKKLTHPISNQDIYVCIYGISGDSVRQALMMEERNSLGRIFKENLSPQTSKNAPKINEKHSPNSNKSGKSHAGGYSGGGNGKLKSW